MHPAYSIIVFTTASGAGLGLLFWLALLGLLHALPVERWLGLCGFGLAFALIAAGLLASAAHLGRPERAWRALSQWRTSWLSREGVMMAATCVAGSLLALGFLVGQPLDGFTALAAPLTMLCCAATLYATGMIYASLRAIRQWHQPLTVPIYIVLGLSSGALLLNLLARIFGMPPPGLAVFTGGTLIAGCCLKWAYWLRIDGEARTFSAETATGLGPRGKVRLLEPPHTQPNFIMREMGYRVARKHAERLRKICLLLTFALPTALLLLPLKVGAGILAAGLACLSAGAGLLIERWLFFAEAEHVSMLYYGRDAA